MHGFALVIFIHLFPDIILWKRHVKYLNQNKWRILHLNQNKWRILHSFTPPTNQRQNIQFHPFNKFTTRSKYLWYYEIYGYFMEIKDWSISSKKENWVLQPWFFLEHYGHNVGVYHLGVKSFNCRCWT